MLGNTDALARIDIEIKGIQSRIAAIQSDPINQLPAGSFWKYTPRARKVVDRLSMDIANLIAAKRKLNGNPVPCSGYSGRQTNRR